MKYKIEDIREECENLGWKLLSDKYTNLKTEMEFVCPEGHKIFQTYGKWRAYHECPICRNNPIKMRDMKIIAKPIGVTRILAFDQATNTSGWAVFDNGKLVQCGTFNTSQTVSVEKIESVRQWVASMIDMWQPTRVALEDIQLQQHGGGDNIEGVTTYKILAQLQGVLINYFYNNNIKYDVVHSATWRSFCQIKGKSRSDKKRSAQLKVKEWYDCSVSQDEADAICIGRYEAEKNIRNSSMVEW